MEKNSDRPAFYQGGYGLTKREYFAAMAMQGLCASLNTIDGHTPHIINVSGCAVRIADQLLKQLSHDPR